MTILAQSIAPVPFERVSFARRIAPSLSLALLAPFIAEVLSGATRLSYFFVYVPEVMFWGVGALLIRETTMRWGRSWVSVFTLGLALSVAEEVVVQQTSIAPLVWVGSQPIFGRVGGVNWPYFLYMVGYETVWVVLVPILLSELLFPTRRDEPWVSRGGLCVLAGGFLVGALIAWYLWTQQARTIVFHAAPYDPPVTLLLAGVAAIVLLCILARHFRRNPADAAESVTSRRGRSPAPSLVCLGALTLGLAWQLLLGLVLYIPEKPPLAAVMLGGIAWSVLSFMLVRRWASGQNWGDRHAWGLVFGALLACMIPGYLDLSAWSRLDVIGKLGSNALAVVGMLALGASIWRRSRCEPTLPSRESRATGSHARPAFIARRD